MVNESYVVFFRRVVLQLNVALHKLMFNLIGKKQKKSSSQRQIIYGAGGEKVQASFNSAVYLFYLQTMARYEKQNSNSAH